MTTSNIQRAIDAVWRIGSAKLIASLARIVRDVGLAEDLAQDALVIALEQWPETGIPNKPGAWLMATAKHRACGRGLARRGSLFCFSIKIVCVGINSSSGVVSRRSHVRKRLVAHSAPTPCRQRSPPVTRERTPQKKRTGRASRHSMMHSPNSHRHPSWN
jgi:DNA-directed RNA polymerase specialized sigma24 family protein